MAVTESGTKGDRVMTDQRIRLITDANEASRLGVRVGDHVREPDPVPSFASIFPPPGENYDGPSDTVITDRQLDAATLAYVSQRYPNVETWRTAFPEAWRETRKRIHAALIAAAAVR
jgi:hypothetical protein